MVDPSRRGFSFVHAADLHLDTPFKGIHAVAPFVAEALREASLDAFDAIIELALERQAAFLVIAGDLYDGADRGLRAQLRLRDGLARLARAGIASFIVHGNHDPVTTGWSAINAWPELVTVFPHDRVEVVPVVRGGEVIATVQGISFARRDTTENLALRLSRPASDGVHVGVLHCDVQGASQDEAPYSPCTLDDLRATRLDYLALGHIHQHQVLARGASPGDPTVVYAGNSQARSPKPSERGPKGAAVVEVEDGVVRRVEHVACDKVRFATIKRSIEPFGSLDALEDQLVADARDELERSDGRSLVLRAELVGRGELHRDLARRGVAEDLVRHLRDGAPTRVPFCWWDAIDLRSAPPLDVAALASRGDFAADLVTATREIASTPDELTALAAELAGSVPRLLFRDIERVVDGEDRQRELLERAMLRALEELAVDAS